MLLINIFKSENRLILLHCVIPNKL